MALGDMEGIGRRQEFAAEYLCDSRSFTLFIDTSFNYWADRNPSLSVGNAKDSTDPDKQSAS